MCEHHHFAIFVEIYGSSDIGDDVKPCFSDLAIGKIEYLCPNIQQNMTFETTKLTQELAVRLEQGETFVSGAQWQTEK